MSEHPAPPAPAAPRQHPAPTGVFEQPRGPRAGRLLLRPHHRAPRDHRDPLHTLGPALGGTRFLAYADEQAALTDVLHLSRGMTYKAAVAGLSLGGGKAVIIGDPATLKTPALLRSYGRFVEGLGGRYWTACDVGTSSADMDVIAETCRSRDRSQRRARRRRRLLGPDRLRRAPGHAGRSPGRVGYVVAVRSARGRRRRRQGRPAPGGPPRRGGRARRGHRRRTRARSAPSPRPTARSRWPPTPPPCWPATSTSTRPARSVTPSTPTSPPP